MVALAWPSRSRSPEPTRSRWRQPRTDASRSTALRSPRLSAARGRRSFVTCLGRPGVTTALTPDFRLQPAARQPVARRRLADLHDLGNDAPLRSVELATRN